MLGVAACSKPPNRDNHRKASFPWTQKRDKDGGFNPYHAIRLVVKPTLLTFRLRCQLMA